MSEIVDITKLSVGGLPYKIYSADWTVGFANRASSLTVDFIDEDTDFNAVPLIPSYGDAFDFTVGGASLGSFHLVATEINQNKSLTTLQAKFVDQSSLLDRVFVMLKGQTGFPAQHVSTGNKNQAGEISASSVIFVGTKIDICVGEILDITNGSDPCSPCNDKTENEALFNLDCIEQEECKRERFDYGLGELIDKLGPVGLSASMGTIKLNEGDLAYRVNYTGSLRRVLNNLCADLGLSFYFFGSTLYFFDLRFGITIDDSLITGIDNAGDVIGGSEDLGNLITAKRIKKSLEGTRANAGVGYFGRDCERRKYECGINTCKKLRLSPMTLRDLLTGNELHYRDESYLKGDKIQQLEFTCGLTRLDTRLRQLAVWGSEYFYNIKTATDLEVLEGETLHVYNGMKIGKVYHKDSSGYEKNRYNILLRLYAGEESGSQVTAKEKKVYFFLAEASEGGEDRVLKTEGILANEFIGKYWYRHYKERHGNAEYNYMAPDGTVTFYDYNAPISLPFYQNLEEMYQGALSLDLFEKEKDEDGNEVNAEVQKTRDSFVLMEKNGAWGPVGLEKEQKEVLDGKEKFLPKELSLNQDISFEREFPEYDKKIHTLFVVEEEMEADSGEDTGGGDGAGKENPFLLEITGPTELDNPLEKGNKNVDTEVCNKKTTYGLRDIRCAEYKLSAEGFAIDLYTPAQVFEEVGASKAGYSIIVGKSADDGEEWYLNKMEVFGYHGFPSISDPYSSIDMTLSDITREDFKYISEDTANTCIIDAVKLSTHLRNYVKQFSYSDPMFEERSYTCVGIPSIDFDPSTGVSSASFRIGSGGVQTTVNFNNRSPARLSPDVVMRRLQYMELRKYKQYNVPSKLSASDDSNDIPEIDS